MEVQSIDWIHWFERWTLNGLVFKSQKSFGAKDLTDCSIFWRVICFWDQHLLGWFIPYSSLEGGRKAGVKSRSLGEYVKRQILSQVTSKFRKFSRVTAPVAHKDSGVVLVYSIFSSFWQLLRYKLPIDLEGVIPLCGKIICLL